MSEEDETEDLVQKALDRIDKVEADLKKEKEANARLRADVRASKKAAKEAKAKTEESDQLHPANARRYIGGGNESRSNRNHYSTNR